MDATKRRICIITPSHWSARVGGAETQARILVERLIASDEFDVHYLARRIGPGYQPRGYSLHMIHARRSVFGTFILDGGPLSRLLEELSPAAIYQRVGCAYTGIAARYARNNACTLIWHVSSDRDLLPPEFGFSLRQAVRRLNKAFVDYGARHAARVVVQNAQQADLLRERYGRSDAVCIPNFHPLPQAPPGKQEGRLTVCWIGNVKLIKSPEVFVRLAADLRQRADVEFVMMGAPGLRPQLWERFLRDVSEVPNLRYVGARPQVEAENLMAQAHVLVNTSPHEGFPNTFIQAWMRRAAVLSLSVNPDGVFDGERFGICAQGSYDRLKLGLDRLLADSELRNRMADRADAFARDAFSVRNADRVIALLR